MNQASTIENNFSVMTLEQQVSDFMVGRVLDMAQTLTVGGSVAVRHVYDKVIADVGLSDKGTLAVNLLDEECISFFRVCKLKKSEGVCKKWLHVTTSDGTTTALSIKETP